jgi:hypothetical protein
MRRAAVTHKRLCDWAITRADQPAAGGAAPEYPFIGSADKSLLAALVGGLPGRRLWCMPPISRGLSAGPTPRTPRDRHYGMMLAVARGYVRARASAEEVVQEAWVGVLKCLDRFEGRASLKT